MIANAQEDVQLTVERETGRGQKFWQTQQRYAAETHVGNQRQIKGKCRCHAIQKKGTLSAVVRRQDKCLPRAGDWPFTARPSRL